MGATREAIQVMQEEGVNLSGHQAQRLEDHEIKEANLIFVMEEYHREAILAQDPSAKERIHMLGITDPIGQSVEVYRKCLEKIKNSLAQYENLL